MEDLVKLVDYSSLSFYSSSEADFFYVKFPKGISLKPASTTDWSNAIFSSSIKYWDHAFKNLCNLASVAKPAQRISRRSLLIADRNTDGSMVHVLLDHLYRYWLAKEKEIPFDRVLLLATTWDWARYVAENVINIEEDKITYLLPLVNYNIEEVVIASNSFPNSKKFLAMPRLRHPANNGDIRYYQFLRKKFADFRRGQKYLPTLHSDCRQKLFISRKLTSARAFQNHDLIENEFRRRGYALVYMEDYSTYDQIMTMLSWTHVAGFHGAGLTNIIAAGNLIRVIEILGTKYTSAFEVSAKACGYDYIPVNKLLSTDPLILDMDNLTSILDRFG